jgi:hypothetical protein
MKDCEVIESFDRKFEKFRSKDSELEESGNEISESFDRKIHNWKSQGMESWKVSIESLRSFRRKILFQEMIRRLMEDPNHDPPSKLKLISVIFIKEVTLI